ncbi:hypothetical protein ABII15_34355 [Streptomyces sp. HUAS MG91]|uniref:Integral membrane protein n=1 Tax=Streptomyces tabacisoli TaxID=3156398 RepID=A0AAU8J1V6_9ACTN
MSQEQAPGPAEPARAAEAGEVERLRAEVAELRDRVGSERRRRARLLLVRRTLAAVLIALVAVVGVTSVVGLWGARTALNTDRWVSAVGPLPQDPAVNKAVSVYLTDQIFDQLDVRKKLSDALPPRAAFLAGPVSGAVHDSMGRSVSKLLATDQFRALWEGANRLAHEKIVAVAEKRDTNVRVQGDTVTLNLLPMANNLLNSLEAQLPSLFGKKLNLPTLTSGELPPGLHDRIEKALGVRLPDDFAQIRLYNRHDLGRLQQTVVVCKRALVALLIAVPVLLALALWAAPDRRRTLLQLGVWLVVTVTALHAVLRVVRGQLLGQVPQGVYRDGLRAALWTVFTTLRDLGDLLLWLGAGLAVLMYLIGPGRLPVALRRRAAQGVRAGGQFAARTGTRIGTDRTMRTWIARHADVLRVGGALVAVLVVLLLSTWPALFVVGALLAAYEIAVTLLARDAGSPPAGEAGGAGPAKTGASG